MSEEAAVRKGASRVGRTGVVDVRTRVDEDALAERIVALARLNEALDDFAALVAHELSNALLAASDRADVRRAMDLVDELLEVARGEGEERWAAVGAALDQALGDVGERPASVIASLPDAFPLARTLLRVVLRNLIANATAAGARTVRVTAERSGDRWTLAVDDDGLGLRIGTMTPRPGANGIGLALCRRIAERHGGSLGLGDSTLGGASVTLTVRGALP
jgi:signal transduction histidine kinase